MKRAQPKSPGTGTRPEIELLLCCARTHIDLKTLDRLRGLLGQELDWDYLLRMARIHGVIPLLYASLQENGREAVPKPAWDQLQNRFRANIHHSFFLTAELLKILDVFETHGIKAIPFKGPILAASAYRDLTLRQFGDLDLLVHKQDIFEAAKLLVSQGYQSESKHEEASECDMDHDEAIFHGPKYYTFSRPDGRSRVDLQWRITERYFSFSLDKEHLWQRLDPVPIAARTVRTFTPTDTLLILCVHGSKHRWEKLKWVCDVAELVRAHKSEIDWGLLYQEASAQRVERMLTLGLAMARGLLGAELPEEILKAIRADARTNLLVPQIRERLFTHEDRSPSRLQRIMFYLRIKDHWHDRAQFWLRYLSQWFEALVTPTSIERSVLPLPAYLSFLYFVFRPLRLTAKYVWLGLTLICNGKNSAR